MPVNHHKWGWSGRLRLCHLAEQINTIAESRVSISIGRRMSGWMVVDGITKTNNNKESSTAEPKQRKVKPVEAGMRQEVTWQAT